MGNADVDKFVKARVDPKLRPAVALIRRLMKESAPDAQETISHGIPAFRAKRIIAVISPTKTDITLAFSQGAKFQDKYGLLRGSGNVSKHVKIQDAAEANKAALRDYIKQALALDARSSSPRLVECGQAQVLARLSRSGGSAPSRLRRVGDR